MSRTQINFRLRDQQKQRWRDYVEESRYDDTLSDLIKRSVENQIDRDNGDSPTATTTSEDAMSGKILDEIQNLQNEIEDIETEVSEAVDAVHAQEGLDPDLQPNILVNLPRERENALTAEELAQILGEQSSTIRFALANIKRNTNIVQKEVPINSTETHEGEDVEVEAAASGDPVWWREE